MKWLLGAGNNVIIFHSMRGVLFSSFVLLLKLGMCQTKISSRALEVGTLKALRDVKIKNLTTGAEILSDSMGYFVITVNNNDSLRASKDDYETLTFKAPTSENFFISLKNLRKIESPDEKIFTYVDHPAEFPGGFNNFIQYADKKARRAGIKGIFYVKLVIDTTGFVMPLKTEIIKSDNPDRNQDLIKIFMESPKWKPARQGNKKVKFATTLPIKF
jgi:hypothetical protein